MKVLVINTGSSSLKYQLFDMDEKKVIAKGLCDRIGIEKSFLKHTKEGSEPVIIEKDLTNHKVAIEEVIKALVDPQIGVIKDMSEINAVGHRVVHGGEKFNKSVIIDDKVIETIRQCVELAPLHNLPNLIGIEACREIMPGTPMVAVFDTAFHQTMPKEAYMYGIPFEMYLKYGIRKYGFHGTSHKYVSEMAAEYLKKPIEELKIITCHLGNGASICAVNGGKAVDTSMGFTPLDGLMMGTRSGSIDPAVIMFLQEKENLNPAEMVNFLNKKSGVLGVSGVSSDFRDVDVARKQGNKRAQLAYELFSYRVKKCIGEYAAVLNGVDVIVFTAGIGENNDVIREMTCTGLEYLGAKFDSEKNKQKGSCFEISTDDSKVKIIVIATNEELAIARETKDLVLTK